ncbi:THAP domain-containing protein 11-like [Sinocyclocheilus rhinocerous]|uniref:THAP domain-containing protein 11 n=1 Tax=Sinocyclocheilus rhinocerous TaxID=307959 RepID=A0A673J376_9TELE|nr:PREDICTED: THAP domain-containing protein 11-like [Sinocyclocheilus rhinocerous]
MPGFTCCVPGCYNNSHRDRDLRFYTFPKDPAQREIWLKNISRAGVSGCFSTFQPTTGHRVCSVHFPGGRKTYTIRVPTLFPLRGVNERKSRRGRSRKVSAVVSTANESVPVEEEGDTENATVVQIGQNGQYITPVDFTSSGDGSCLTAVVSGGNLSGGSASCPVADLVLCGVDHSYSLTTGTTSAELLRKLNEQRDIIALMEIKMKETKNIIRQLRVNEARLQEELRERDRLISANTIITRKL